MKPARLLMLLAALLSAPALADLQGEVESIASRSGGTLGVGVRHLERGQELYFNRGERFLMGSLFKLPLAVQLLGMVEQRQLALDKPVLVQASDLRPGSGKLSKSFGDPVAMSLRDLLETMLIDSDNTATDLLWKEAGGSQAVMARLALLQVKGINVARPTGPLLAAAVGLEPYVGTTDMTPARLDEFLRQYPRKQRTSAISAFLKDERDTTSPEAFVALLTAIWRGDALEAPQRTLLLDIMQRCATGRGRMPAGLPRGTVVARKTGTLRPFAANDAGIITLPGNKGHVALVVLVRESSLDLPAQEKVIADVARAVYGHFMQ